MNDDFKPRHLGVRSGEAVEQVDLIPWDRGPVSVTLTCSEFTALCPVTAQPDFGTITVTYVPDRHLIETKSMKLYLMRFRQVGIFGETLVDTIAEDLWTQVRPRSLSVEGQFQSRGGIRISARSDRPTQG